ncbi:MAG: beta-N-acetylhexosaminidase [Saprospiraceae bacterium]|nr:beta-N-acetylhexosaminidase [Saprospiraceae bacterium]
MKLTNLTILIFIIFIKISVIGQNVNIIPQPNSAVFDEGSFNFTREISLQYNKTNKEITEIVKFFTMKLGEFPANTFSKIKNEVPNRIEFYLQKTKGNSEYYELIVQKNAIILRANTTKGMFYGVQSILQLVNNYQRGNRVSIPCMQLQDQPNFSWRGMHLDVSRHFFSIRSIKKYIDLMAYYKMNTFHWHLTDDQGWRIEIKKYPKLTEVGANRKETLKGHYNKNPQEYDGTPYGGFYTQEEIKQVIEYASDRYVTVVPEIEMPGHAVAALAAYPEYGCTGNSIDVATKWGVFDDIYCPTESTFTFLENILSEVIALFPGKYIHIGGDEAPKTRWKESEFCQKLIKDNHLKDEHELQSYFIKRIDRYLTSKGKKMIGWDEILEGGLSPNATVMSWRGTQGGIDAVNQGHDVIMTPTSNCYLDYYQSTDPSEPLAIGGYLPLEKVYKYDPVPEDMDDTRKKLILGTQGNLWTEYIASENQLEYMMLPRILALAETGWTKPKMKNFEDFCGKLDDQFDYFNRKKLNYADKLSELNSKVSIDDEKGLVLDWFTFRKKDQIKYEIYNENGAMIDEGTVKDRQFTIEKSGKHRAYVLKKGAIFGNPIDLDFFIHKAAGKKITLTNDPAKQYSGNGKSSLINGLRGSTERYGGPEWLGFSGKDAEAIIDLGNKLSVSSFATSFFHAPGQWIRAPKEVIIYGSEDGIKYNEIGKAIPEVGNEKIVRVDFPLKSSKPIQYVKVLIKRHGIISVGEQGEGNEAWLFVDELEVK